MCASVTVQRTAWTVVDLHDEERWGYRFLCDSGHVGEWREDEDVALSEGMRHATPAQVWNERIPAE